MSLEANIGELHKAVLVLNGNIERLISMNATPAAAASTTPASGTPASGTSTAASASTAVADGDSSKRGPGRPKKDAAPAATAAATPAASTAAASTTAASAGPGEPIAEAPAEEFDPFADTPVETKVYTIEDARAGLKDLAKDPAGKAKAIAILAKLGAKTIGDIKPDQIASVMSEVAKAK